MKSIKFITVIILLLAVFELFAENEDKTTSCTEVGTTIIKGTISDAGSGELLPGVSINLEGIEKTYYTDFDGNFIIEDIQPGKYDITFSYISYKSAKQEEVKVDKNQLTEIILAMEHIR